MTGLAAGASRPSAQHKPSVQEARDSTQQTADRLRAECAPAADRADAWADNIQCSWDEHLARARERIDARRRSTPPIARSPTPRTPSPVPPPP